MTQTALQFLAGNISDHRGRTVHDYLTMTVEDWEGCHDVVQWAFPTATASKFNANAPVLEVRDDGVHHIFDDLDGVEENAVRANALFLLHDYFAALGLDFDMNAKTIKASDGFTGQLSNGVFWVERYNHNLLRLTRILEWTGYWDKEIQTAIYNFLMYEVAFRYRQYISSETILYWVATYHNERYLIPTN